MWLEDWSKCEGRRLWRDILSLSLLMFAFQCMLSSADDDTPTFMQRFSRRSFQLVSNRFCTSELGYYPVAVFVA